MIATALATLSLLVAIQGAGKGNALPPMRQLLGNFSFDKVDTDKDKSLSREEVQRATFAWLDKNNDKLLDVNELAKLPAEKSAWQEARDNESDRKEKKAKEKEKGKGKDVDPGAPPLAFVPGDERKDSSGNGKDEVKPTPAKQHLDRMDANKDGKVSFEEFSIPEAWWSSVDLDRDGKISRDEFLGKAKPAESDNSKKKLNAVKFANMTAEEAMEELDGDRDGRISRAEWALSEKLFDRVDADGDGSLSKEEVSAALEVAKQMLKGRSSPPPDGKGDSEKEKKDAGKGGTDKKPSPKPGEEPPL